MDSKDLKALMESYSAVYQDENDLQEDFDAIDELTDQELEEVVEEVILNLLDEGYEIEDVEEIFEEEICEEIIAEAKVDMAARAAARKQYAQSSEKAAGQARKAGAAVVAKEKRAAQVARVKGAVKSGVAKVKGAVKSAVSKAKEAGKEAKFQAVDKRVASYAAKRNLHPAPGLAARAKDPAKRRALRTAVAKDVAGRAAKKAGEMKRSATQKAASAAVSGYAAARSAKQAVSDTAGRAAQSVKNKAAVAKRGVSAAASGAKSAVKSGVGKLARKLASKAGSVASRLGEEVDVYDLVLQHLIREGYAETQDQAVKIMANMSEEWRTEIIKSEIHS